VGVLQPIRQLADMARAKGALFHCDAAQLLGKVPLPSCFLDADYASFSAHKLYGPKGVGMLLVRRGTPRSAMKPVLLGGGQEGMLRPGTLNVPGIVGTGAACRLARNRIPQDVSQIGALRARLEQSIARALPTCWINGSRAARLPGTSSLCIPGVPATMLTANVPHLCIGEGSACASGAPEPSHVLLAMGLSRDNAECTIRISLGRQNSVADVDEVTASVARAAQHLSSAMSRTSTPEPCPAGGKRV
jgi:cysteine desulfurase